MFSTIICNENMWQLKIKMLNIKKLYEVSKLKIKIIMMMMMMMMMPLKFFERRQSKI